MLSAHFEGELLSDALSRPASKERFTIKMLDGSTVIIDNPESVFYEYPRSMFSDEEWDNLELGDQPSARFTTVDPDDPRVPTEIVEASATDFFLDYKDCTPKHSVDGQEIVRVFRGCSACASAGLNFCIDHAGETL